MKLPVSLEGWAAILLVLALGAYLLSLTLFAPTVQLVSMVDDDAFYYFKVAANIAAGNGPTFDQINLTNGVQPLWTLILVPIYLAIPSDPDMAFRAVFALSSVLACLSMALLYRTVAENISRAAGLVSAVGFLWPRFLNQAITGVETGLLVFLLLLTFRTMIGYNVLALQTPWRNDLVLGILLGFIALTRLDSVFLIVAVLLFLLGSRIQALPLLKGEAVKGFALRVAFLFSPIIVVSVPYFYWTISTFGHIMPISGALKSRFPEVVFNIGNLTSSLEWGVLAVFGALLAGTCWLNFRQRWQDLSERSNLYAVALSVLGTAVVLHYTHEVLFIYWGNMFWHYTMYSVTFLLGLPWLLCLSFRWAARGVRGLAVEKALRVAALVVFLTVVLGQVISVTRRGEAGQTAYLRQYYYAAMWARENTPPQAILSMKDAGIFGYFSGRRVVNLDGLVNNYEYQEYLRDGRFGQYVADKGIEYVVTTIFLPRAVIEKTYEVYEFASHSYLFNRTGGLVPLKRSDEVYRAPIFPRLGGGSTTLLIFRI